MLYQTRDLVATRPMLYDGQDLQPGDRFRPMSDVDSDYLIKCGRAALADASPAPVAAPEPDPTPAPVEAAAVVEAPPEVMAAVVEQAVADVAAESAPDVPADEPADAADATEQAAPTGDAPAAPRRRGRPTNAERAAAAAAQPDAA